MRQAFAFLGALFVFCFLSASVWAKGDMVLIEIRGESRPQMIKVTDPNIQAFHVWTGPGVNGVLLEHAEGFIADWKNGVVPEPHAGAIRYELSFYVGCRESANCRWSGPSRVYVVTYAVEPSTREGFVYLPGRGDEFYSLNVRTIYRGPGVEGHWFRASERWDRFVEPLIAKFAH